MQADAGLDGGADDRRKTDVYQNPLFSFMRSQKCGMRLRS